MTIAFLLLALIFTVCLVHVLIMLTRARPGRLKRSTWTAEEDAALEELP